MPSRTIPQGLGRTVWVIPEGYVPKESHGEAPEMESHETACILNTNPVDATVTAWVFFKDREPAGPFTIVVPARRTLHVRLNELRDPEPVPKGVDYSTVFESDVPVVVQHSRLDSRQAENALMTTIAYAQP